MTLWNKYKNHPFQWDDIKSFLNGWEPRTKSAKDAYTAMLCAAFISVSDERRIDSTTDDDMLEDLTIKLMKQRPHEIDDAKAYLKTCWRNIYCDFRRKIRKERRKKSDIEEGIQNQQTTACTQSKDDIEEVRTAVLQDILFQFLKSRKGRMKDEWDNLYLSLIHI